LFHGPLDFGGPWSFATTRSFRQDHMTCALSAKKPQLMTLVVAFFAKRAAFCVTVLCVKCESLITL